VVGPAEGAELDEDELLGRLRENGLITYPSPLLSFLEEYPDLVRDEVLPRLDSTDRAVFAQVGPPLLAAVVASGLPRAGNSAGVPLKLVEFCGSVGRLAWARVNGCPWEMLTCAYAAAGGHLEVLVWARERGCEWDEDTSVRRSGRAPGGASAGAAARVPVAGGPQCTGLGLLLPRRCGRAPGRAAVGAAERLPMERVYMRRRR